MKVKNRRGKMVVELPKHEAPESLIEAIRNTMQSPSRPAARRAYQAMVEHIDRYWDEITDHDDPDFPIVFVHPQSETHPKGTTRLYEEYQTSVRRARIEPTSEPKSTLPKDEETA